MRMKELSNKRSCLLSAHGVHVAIDDDEVVGAGAGVINVLLYQVEGLGAEESFVADAADVKEELVLEDDFDGVDVELFIIDDQYFILVGFIAAVMILST